MSKFTTKCINTQRSYVEEVAPEPVITPQRYSSISPKLDTIYEEGSHSSPDRQIHHPAQGDPDRTVEIGLTRRVAYPLPRLIHLLTYGFTRGLPSSDFFRTC